MRSTRGVRQADVKAAPWGAAAPLAIGWIAGLVIVLVVADLGGWRQLWLARDSGWITMYVEDPSEDAIAAAIDAARMRGWLPLVVVALGLGTAAAAWLRLRWSAAILVAITGVAVFAYVRDGQRLRYTTLMLGSGDDGAASTAITLYGVVGLLIATAFVAAVVLAVRGRRRVVLPNARTATLALGWLAVVLAAPRVGKLLGDVGYDAFGWTAGAFEGPQAIYLLGVVSVCAVVLAGAAPRRAPVAALAAGIVMVALWIPMVWLGAGLLVEMPVIGPAVDQPWFPLASWGGSAVLGIGLARRCIRRSGEGHAARGSAAPAPA